MQPSFPELAAIRLGFGLSPLMPPPDSPQAVLDSVQVAADPGPDAMTMQKFLQLTAKLQKLDKARKAGDGDALQKFRVHNNMLADLPIDDLTRRVARAVDAPAGFGERLVQFWSDHFTIRADGAANQPMGLAFVDEAIRPHINGNFADLLIAADTHPMMLRYLNQNASYGPNSAAAQNVRNRKRGLGLNENLAREAIELHTLGAGADYAQDDVRQLAELLTGLIWRRNDDRGFAPGMAEPGAETVLGRSYGGDGPARIEDIHAVLTDLARHPATARHLARKLAVHFVSDTPPDALVNDLAAVWRDTQGNLPMVYAALIGHPDLARNFRQKVRQPFDYLASGMRALGVTGDVIRGLDGKRQRNFLHVPLRRMGQPWTRPIGPDGWQEGADAWVTPQGLAARIEWSLQVPARLLTALPDPRGFLRTALGDTASEQLQWAVPKAESIIEGVAIVLASSEFNRR